MNAMLKQLGQELVKGLVIVGIILGGFVVLKETEAVVSTAGFLTQFTQAQTPELEWAHSLTREEAKIEYEQKYEVYYELMEEVQQGKRDDEILTQLRQVEKEISALSERLYGIKTEFICD